MSADLCMEATNERFRSCPTLAYHCVQTNGDAGIPCPMLTNNCVKEKGYSGKTYLTSTVHFMTIKSDARRSSPTLAASYPGQMSCV